MERRMDQTPIPANNTKYRKFDRVRSERIRYGLSAGAFLALRAATDQDLQSLFASVEYLKSAPGDKHLLFFTTQGLVLPGLSNPDVPGNIASLASDAGVRIHSFHIEGSSEKGPGAASGESGRRQTGGASLYALTNLGFSALASMKDLSELTGGQAFISAYPIPSLAAVSDSTQILYLLGYAPIEQRLDGQYRRIRVDVSAKNTRVYSRRGYYASPLSTDAETQRRYLRTIAALNSPNLLNDIHVILDRVRRSTSQQEELEFQVTVQVDPEMFRASDGRLTGTLSLAYFLVGEGQRVVAQTWDTVDMNLKDTTYKQVLRPGVKVDGTLPRPNDVRKGRVKVVVYSPQSDLLGSTERNWKE
jgi:hypothetical protein